MRWELGAWKSRRIEARDFQRIHAVALPTVQAAVAKLKEQLKNPLAADDAVLLLSLADVRKATDGLVAVDDQGGKLPLSDSPIARYRSTNNLEMAAGAALDGDKLRKPASLLVRLYVALGDEMIHGQPLALVVGDQHIRLGM